MKTEYKFIRFQKFGYDASEKEIWQCVNIRSGSPLCAVGYYKRWKQWVMVRLADDAIFNNQCLRDIASFLDELNGVGDARKD